MTSTRRRRCWLNMALTASGWPTTGVERTSWPITVKPSQTLRVQLKTGLVIDRKYGAGQGPYICFPRDKTCGRWYLVKHSGLVAIVRENTEWLCSAKRKQERRYGELNRYSQGKNRP